MPFLVIFCANSWAQNLSNLDLFAVDWHGRSTDGPGQAEGQAGLAVTAHSDALAPHKDEATEAQDAAQG